MKLFELFGTIAVDNSKANNGIDETTEKAESAHPRISAVFAKIGTAAVNAGKVIATGLAAGAVAVGVLVKSALDNYAQYEQLVGGVETLFKSSASKVQEYAANAFQTAGMSANEYMETATSFSASLIQSLASHTSESLEANLEALDASYEAVAENAEKSLELMQEAQEQEIASLEKATEVKIALINEEYTEKLKLIDEEKYNQLKAIDEQIDALNAQTAAERAAREQKKQEEKIAAYESKINAAKTAEERLKAEKDLADYLEELAQKEREVQRKAEIESLKDQQQTIKDQADAKKKALQEQQKAEVNAVKESSEAQLKELKKAHKRELDELKESNDAKLKETARYVSEQKAILESNATTMEYTAETYEKAADYANRAIIDMSDNANKMGTDMSMIQNAYQGFAKQNYTMLDNLKLGYGGTKEEMERLLADAEKLTGQDYDISSFADIVDAIHAIQVEMEISGLTAEEAAEMVASGAMTEEEAFAAMGTTAKEASSTISGSLGMAKAAWDNLLVGFADGSQDSSVLVGRFVASVTMAARNIVPRIAQILGGISAALPPIISALSAEIPGILQELLPGLIEGALALMVGLVESLPMILEILIAELPNILTQLAVALIAVFPILFDTVKALFGQLWDYIAVELLGTETDFESSFAKIEDFFRELWKACLEIWDTLGQPILDGIQSAVTFVYNDFAERMPEIKEFVSECFKDIGVFWNDHLKPCFEAIGAFIDNVLAPAFQTFFNETIDSAFQSVKSLWNDVLKPVFTGITDFITGVFFGDWEKAWEGIVDTFKGIINLIPLTLETVVNGAISLVNGLIDGINSVSGLVGVDAISPIPTVTIPKLEKGGILEKGQIGLLEGNGAEAVVPLDQNYKWINAVARDMEFAMGGGNNEQTQRIIDLLETLVDMLPATMTDAFKSMKFDINNREFARMVKAVE